MASHICCNRCRTSLLFRLNGKRKQMPFSVAIVWREQSDHVTDYYFCMTNNREFFRKNSCKISSKVCRSAIKPISHGPDLPASQLPTEKKTACMLMNVRIPVMKMRRNLLNQIPPFNMCLRHSSSIRNA